jgi:hypothetical protein
MPLPDFWAAAHSAPPAPSLPDCSCLQLKIMVPWMHAFDHNLACQRKFSGLYQVCACLGRSAGWLLPRC